MTSRFGQAAIIAALAPNSPRVVMPRVRAYRGQKGGAVVGFEQAVHLKGFVQRLLIPFRLVANLQDMRFCHLLRSTGLNGCVIDNIDFSSNTCRVHFEKGSLSWA